MFPLREQSSNLIEGGLLYSHNTQATVAAMGISCQASHYCRVQASQLRPTIDNLSFPEVCMVSVGTMKASPKRKFTIQYQLAFSTPVAKVCGFFRNRFILVSFGQPDPS